MDEKWFEHEATTPIASWSKRRNHLPMEGGALNAGYTKVDALCKISNMLGRHGLEYEKDWWWEGFGTDFPMNRMVENVRLQFAKEEYILLLSLTEEYYEDA